MMSVSWLEYSVTRPFNIKYMNLTLLVLGSIWTCLVTVVMIAAVGYENSQVYLNTFNPESSLWYEKMLPNSGLLGGSTVCQGSSIKAGDRLTLLGNADTFVLSSFLDASSPIEELIYRGDPLANCSANQLLLQTSDPIGQRLASFECNTSSAQYILFDVVVITLDPLNLIYPCDAGKPSNILNNTNPLNVTTTMSLMQYVRNSLSELLMPSTDTSLFYNSVTSNNLSYFTISYDVTGNNEGTNNTPANDHWTLGLEYRRNNLLNSTTTINITFLPTGEIDFSRTSRSDLSMANAILSPTISILQEAAQASGIELDFWRLMNWLIVAAYWNVLADLGVYSPTNYLHDADANSGRDFSRSTLLPSTNNIFINDTLYEIYTQFMLETVMPLVDLPVPPAGITPLGNENTLVHREVALAKSYFCSVRQLKSPIVGIVSILVGEYAFIHGAYRIFIFLATWYQKRGELNANSCEGCCSGKLRPPSYAEIKLDVV